MSQFLRLLSEADKANALLTVCTRLRKGLAESRAFEMEPESFDAVPGKPFAYWVSDAVRQTFKLIPSFENDGRTVKQGLASADDFRFVRGWWEIGAGMVGQKWFTFAKGGAYSPFYSDVYLMVNWDGDGSEIKNNLNEQGGVRSNVWMLGETEKNYFRRPGLTWPRRTQQFGVRVMATGNIFADKGPAAFDDNNDSERQLSVLALMLSRPFGALIELSLNAGDTTARSFEVGIIQKTPLPDLSYEERQQLAALAKQAWSLKRTLDTTTETSHAFLLPAAIRSRLGDYDPPGIEVELGRLQAEIDAVAFDLYGFSESDRLAAQREALPESGEDAENIADEESDDESSDSVDTNVGLISWTVGVAFGRFDWRLATGERAAPPEPEPFDPLPAKSPGMLPDGSEPFHVHTGILVDDQGDPHDLAHLVEEVLGRVDMPVPDDVRRWLQKDFFAFHLQRYSKSRRKAPIYWPLATASGSYTLWVYYPSLTSQTLYTAINDFVEPKLKQVGGDVATLRNKGTTRSRDDEKQFETLQAFELELFELRDTLLKIAPGYQPNHDDGVQITAAPLWPLFRHKPWQKILKDTATKLEKGEYDWAHLAMNYWPDRVREKCKSDKSLAIAHGLEALYVEPDAKPKQTRGKKNAGEIE